MKKLLRMMGLLKKSQSTYDALARILDKHAMQRLYIECPDRRNVLEVASEIQCTPVVELGMRVADRLGLAFTNNVMSCDVGVLSEQLNISNFRKVGAVPLTQDGKIVGVVCVDPQLLKGVLGTTTKYPLYLSVWKNIATALDQSEELYVKSQQEETEKIANQVVSFIIREVESFGGQSCILKFLKGELRYEFVTADDKKAHGSINPKASASLEKFLGEFNRKHNVPFVLMGTDEQRWLEASICYGDPLEVRISWKQTEAARVIINNVIPLQLFEKQREPNPTIYIQPEAVHTTGIKCPQRQVLVIEDNKTFARVLERFLERHDITVTHIEDGSKVGSYLENVNDLPDVIICDLHMPGFNGRRVLSAVKGHPHGSNIPVIMLTSDTEVEAEVELIKAGAEAFVGKNEDPRVLYAHVEKLLARKLKQKAA